MKKSVKIFSDGSMSFHINIEVKNKKFQILEKDHKEKNLLKKGKTFSNQNFEYLSKYKTYYFT